MLKIWICHIRIQLAGVTGSGTSVRPWTRRSWLLVVVFCRFVDSPALDFQSLSHSANPLSSAAWGLSLMCMPALFPCPVCPAWKPPHSCQKDISKNTKGELCQAGHFYARVCWVRLATLAEFSSCLCWGNLLWEQEGAQLCSSSPQHMAAWEKQWLQLLLGGSPAESLPLWTHSRWGRWEHVAASLTEASLEIVCVWAGCRLLCLGTAESVGKLLSEKDVPKDRGQWEFSWTESEESRKASLQWCIEPGVGVRALPEIEQPELEMVLWPSPSERSFPKRHGVLGMRRRWPLLGQKRKPATACCLPLSNTRQLKLQQEIGGRLTKGLLLSRLCGPVKRSCNSHPVWLFLPWTSPVTCFPFQIRLTPSKIRNLLETWSLLETVVSTSLGGFCTVLGVGRVQGWKGSWSLDWEGDRKTTDGEQHSSLGWAHLSSARYLLDLAVPGREFVKKWKLSGVWRSAEPDAENFVYLTNLR